MATFKKKPVVVDAITFDELVAFGREIVDRVLWVNNMPLSFQYKGHGVTHENDDCYLIPTLEGIMRFDRGDMLITGIAGEIYPCKPDIFKQTYESVPEQNSNPHWHDLFKELKRQHLMDLAKYGGCFQMADVLTDISGVLTRFEKEHKI